MLFFRREMLLRAPDSKSNCSRQKSERLRRRRRKDTPMPLPFVCRLSAVKLKTREALYIKVSRVFAASSRTDILYFQK